MRPVGRTSGRPLVGAPEGPGGDEAAGKAGQEPGDLGFSTGFHSGCQGGFDLGEDCGCGWPVEILWKAVRYDLGCQEFESFDRVAGRAPRIWGEAVEKLWTGAGPRGCHVAVEGVEGVAIASADAALRCAPLCPTGHLPRKGGDRTLFGGIAFYVRTMESSEERLSKGAAIPPA